MKMRLKSDPVVHFCFNRCPPGFLDVVNPGEKLLNSCSEVMNFSQIFEEAIHDFLSFILFLHMRRCSKQSKGYRDLPSQSLFSSRAYLLHILLDLPVNPNSHGISDKLDPFLFLLDANDLEALHHCFLKVEMLHKHPNPELLLLIIFSFNR
jgi:hypothetical protein